MTDYEAKARELWKWDEETLGGMRFPPSDYDDPITFEEYKVEWIRGIAAALDAAEKQERERCRNIAVAECPGSGRCLEQGELGCVPCNIAALIEEESRCVSTEQIKP